MIDNEELRSAGDQLRTAWNNYIYAFSELRNHHTQGNAPGFSPELAHQLDTELAFIFSYEPKIQWIKATISHARNYSSGLAPINTLPPEILARIFHLVLAQPCEASSLRFGEKTSYLKQLDNVTQVCHLWRRTAISSCSIWSHIDLSPAKRTCDKLIARAKLHVARAGVVPIKLHVRENEFYDSETAYHAYHDGLHTLLSPIYNRVEALEVDTDAFENFQRTLFRNLFSHEDSILTKLALRCVTYHPNNAIVATGTRFDDTAIDQGLMEFELDLAHNELERGFARLTTLHLRGVFPLWSSKAYHGLVDLRLLSTDRWSRISETGLMTVLKSSPGLRILHFGLQVDSPTPVAVEVTPVHLQDLQVVRIFPENDEEESICPSTVLRLLAPGTKPLCLSFDGRYQPNDILLVELEKFFSRSRVARFYNRAVTPPISILLRHAGNLEVASLHDFVSSTHVQVPRAWLEVDRLASLPHLKSLHISKSIPYERELHMFLKCCPTGTVLYDCTVQRDDGTGWLNPAELSRIFPSVKITNTPLYQDPMEDWGILD
ncbi:unnamed protein product [Rhizoctonia solani]|nr:unnamed protein product [Rhizoctonia solani]